MMKLWKIDTEDMKNELACGRMISYICFLFLLLGVSGYHVNTYLYTLFSSNLW